MENSNEAQARAAEEDLIRRGLVKPPDQQKIANNTRKDPHLEALVEATKRQWLDAHPELAS